VLAVGALVLGAALAAGCSGGSGSGGGEGGEGGQPATSVRERGTAFAAFGETVATVTAADGRTCEVCLLVADTPEQRRRGLMEVTDPALGGYDGMVFVNEQPEPGGFWMRNTRIPLTAVFFDGDGAYLSAESMVPCPDDVADANCPSYAPPAPFLYGVELADRSADDLLMTEGSRLELADRPCPATLDGRDP